jgi:thiol:disulfide interchange protein
MLLLIFPIGIAFEWLRNYLDNRPIEWVTCSANALDENLRAGRMVMINFTATWDVNTRMHEVALETPAVRRRIRALDIVPLRADYTDGSPEIEDALKALGQRVIGVVAIYRPQSPEKPLVLSVMDGWMTEQAVLDALERAHRRD